MDDDIFYGMRKYIPGTNKKKILLHRASIDYYMEYLKKNNVRYSYINKNFDRVNNNKFMMYRPYDKELEYRYDKTIFIDNPNFILTHEELEYYYEKTKNNIKHIQQNFFKYVKNKIHFLENIPSQDKYNRERMKVKLEPNYKLNFDEDIKYIDKFRKVIDRKYSDNIGDVNDFIFPVTHKTAKNSFKKFIKYKLTMFGKYQDYIDVNNMLLYHSGLSTVINIGLINPNYILKYLRKIEGKVDNNNIEGYVRQLFGWREYQRFIYHFYYDKITNINIFNHSKKLSNGWYSGNVGNTVVDNMINNGIHYGYLHHIIRLMIIGNYMNLNEIHPYECYRWFQSKGLQASRSWNFPQIHTIG